MEIKSPLISLITKKKEAFEGGSIMCLIRRDFAMVEEAREAGLTWAEIAEAYSHPGKAAQARYAFFYERRRRKKSIPHIRKDEQKGGIKTAAHQQSQKTEVPNLGTTVKIEMTKEQSEKSTWREIKY